MKRAVSGMTLALVLVLVVACLMLGVAGHSQGITFGSISGTVVDPSGAAIPGATVTAVNTATGVSMTADTSDAGFFSFQAAPQGTYNLTITAKNFRTAAMANIVVSVSRNTGLGEIKLELGQVTGQTVVVEGGAPLIESSTSQVTNTFGNAPTQNLPLNGGFDMLTLLVPGVADTGSSNFSNTNGVGFSANGLRGRSNDFQIDGQYNNDNSIGGPSIFMGNQDALQEVSVITSGFDAEYGRASGTVVNYVTKSGTNEFHGTAFNYYTGSLFDSRDNLTSSSSPIPRYVENRFGGSFGGPIKRNKAWFFFTPYFDRIRSAGAPSTSGTNLTPTPNGITQLAAAFPGNPAVAALQAIGPYAVAAGNPHPLATQTVVVSDGTTSAPIEFAPVQRNVPSLFNDREFTGRVDVQITDKDRASARYIFQQNIATGAAGRFAAGAWVDIPARDQQIALDWVHTFNGNFVNQARYSFSRAGFGFEGGSFPNCTRSNIFACPTGITLQSGVAFGMQNNLPQGRTIDNTEVQDNASFVHGRHTFKFGGEVLKQRSPNTFLPNINGQYTFSSSNSGGSCATQFPGLPSYVGNVCSFSRFLADTPLNLLLTNGPPKFDFKEYDLAFYFGDSWRVKDNLTLTAGLRWDFASQAINLLHDLTVANQLGPNPFWSTSLPASITTLPQIPNQYNYFGPSVGFAWQPKIFGMKGDKTVVRGGYRITYDSAYYNMFLNVATAAPVVNAGNISPASCGTPCLPASGFLGSDVRAAHLSNIPAGGNPGLSNATHVAPDFHNPYTQEWSLGVQRQLTSNFVAEIRYVGNRVNGNFQTVNTNPELDGLIANGFSSLIPAGVVPCTVAGSPGSSTQRPDCNFRNVRTRLNTAWSDYHGLQSQLRIQNWHGLSAGLSYTFSKTLDNNSEIFSTASGGNTVAGAQNPFDISTGEKALSGLDFPNLASIYFVYDLPFFKDQQGFLGHALGGWQMTSEWHYSSGQLWTPAHLPFTDSSCQNSFDNSFFGISTCRPFMGNPSAPVDTVGQCTNAALPDCGLIDFFAFATTKAIVPTTKSAVHWIYNDDTAAAFFGTPYGNVPRNPGVRGQNVNAVNFSLAKSFKLTERYSLSMGAQVYNLFNHRFLGVPDPFIDDLNLANGGTFGNNFSNSSGGDYTNTVNTGLGIRRMILYARFSF